MEGAQAGASAVLVGDPHQQMTNVPEIFRVPFLFFFLPNLHVPDLCFIIEKKKNAGISKLVYMYIIFSFIFSTKTGNENC